MAIQKVTDGLTIVQAAGDTYEGNAADQTYTISPTLTSAGDTIVIIDQGGNNTIELAGGLTIASSVSVADETQLTLSNGAIVNIRGADTFTFAVGANTAAGQTGQDKTFAEFATDVLGVTLPAAGEAAVPSSASVDIEVGGDTTTGPVDPGTGTGTGTGTPTPTDPDFKLTVADDSEIKNGTAGNDTFDATELGSLQDDDLVLDTSGDDADVLNAAVNGSDVKARIDNIETINLTGEYVNTGMALTNVSGAKVVNVDTKIQGGTADITDANSLNAEKIAAGANIDTLNVTSLASGTRDDVTVDAGSASTVKLTGASGADKYIVSVADDAAVELVASGSGLNTSGDEVTLNLAGDASLESANKDELDLVINAAVAAEVELTSGAGVAEKLDIAGTQDATLVSAIGADIAGDGLGTKGVEVTSSTTGISTLKITELNSGTGFNFGYAGFDTIEIADTDDAEIIVVNQNTKLNLTGDMAGNLTVKLDNGNDDKVLKGGALRVDISETQSSAVIASKVGTGTGTGEVNTLILTATPDEQTDLDQDKNGTNETSLSVSQVTADEVTKTTVVQGAENLIISTMKFGAAGQTLTASSMTGDLTIGSVVGAFDGNKIISGAGGDTITTKLGQQLIINTNAGNDTVDIKTTADAKAGTEVNTGEGNDEVISSRLETTIDLGAGDDEITVGDEDTITLGAGADTITLAAGTGTGTAVNATVKDFVKGEDVVVLTGTATDDKVLDLTDLSADSNGKYIIGNDGTLAATSWEIQLENSDSGLSDTDLSDSIQLKITAGDNSTVVAGSKDDTISVAAAKNATITTGTGDDTIVLNAGTQPTTGATPDAATINATVTDFTVGSDIIVITGAVADDTSVNLASLADTSGDYFIGSQGTGASSGASFKLNDVTVQNNDLTDIVQLGADGANFVVNASSTGVTISGGASNDFVELGNGASTSNNAVFNFSNNGGVDTVQKAAYNDTGSKWAQVSFNNLDGIDAVATAVTDVAANAAKVSDATDASVYVFADSSNGAGASKITTFEKDTGNGYTQAVIDDQVAAFIDANLGTSTGEKYVVVINDESTAAYRDDLYGGTNTEAKDAYAYLVTADADGVQADNIQLIGQFEMGADAFAAADVVSV